MSTITNPNTGSGNYENFCGLLQAAGKVMLCLLAMLVLLMLAAPVSLAQVISSSTVRGVIKDPNGAVVPDATVTLTNIDRGDVRQVDSSSQGSYVFTSINPGKYRIKVEARTFKAFEQTELTVSPAETRSLDITLEIGLATETVIVTQESSPIKTETGERSETITSEQIDNLSLIGRSSLELLRILPGVVNTLEPSDSDFVGFGSGGNSTQAFFVNGVRGTSNNVTIDGSRLVDIGANNGTIITPNNDMVQEVTVKSSNYAAEYGSSSVQISATTKGGSKGYHGQLYYYARPRALSANDRTNTIAGIAQPQSGFHYPGGNIGGPILLPFTKFNRDRDKLFFWVGYEVQRQKADRGARFGTVPTQLERNGDFSRSNISGSPFSAGGQRILCPPTTFGFAGTCSAPVTNFTAFADPFGPAFLKLYPLPNFTPAPGSGQDRFNYAAVVIQPQNRTDLKMRFDYKVTENTNMYVRLAREAENQDSPYGIWWGPSNFELPSHVLGTNLGRSAAVNVTTVLNPTMTNEVVFSASKLSLHNDYADPSKVTKQALGIGNLKLPFDTRSPYAPLQLISWDVGSHLWEAGGGLPLFAVNDSYSFTDTLSKVHGDHTFKFGGSIEQANKVQSTTSSDTGGAEGRIEFENNQARTTGNAFANLYTGRLSTYIQNSDVPVGRFRFWNLDFYGQDAWKVRPNITFEYGLRVSFYPNNYERNGLGVVFDPKSYVRGGGAFLNGDRNRPNGYLLASRGEIPKGVYRKNPPPLFMPRLNLAWDVFKDASTVLRGGAGLFYNRVQGNFQYGVALSPPNTYAVSLDAWTVPANDLTLSNLGSFKPFDQLSATPASTQNLESNQIPRILSTSLSLARKIPFKNVLEISYVATYGRHLPQNRRYNFATLPTLSGTLGNADLSNPLHRSAIARNRPSLNRLLPFPDYSQVTLNEFSGTSSYQAMQLTLNRQFGDLSYFMTYTFSKALGTTAAFESDGSDSQVDPFDTRGRSYGILPFDRTHVFNLSYNYNFPKVARGSFANWFTRGLFNGWQMSGITTLESGRPIKLRFGGSIVDPAVVFSYFGTTAINSDSRVGASGIAPVLLRNPLTGNSGLNDRFLDLAAIQIPAFGTTGAHQSPFYIRSPKRANFDMTFFKNFNITESKRVQFRAGFFNIFNQAFPFPNNDQAGDINLALNTECIATVGPGVPNGIGNTTEGMCDPTAGFRFTQDTINNFGKIVTKRGHRRVELAVKFYF
jgi:hypothetical protein